ncbi:MAG TPA: TonB-dependent receptor [Gemmatimonadaceae bacterium]|jgi:vitamin B12 transporter|nr:TonB-dependent receptor [Gemmatimonadaceae bacterium]
MSRFRWFVLSWTIALPLAAQQTDTARIAPVVVTATRVPISAAAAPATVDVITGEELRLRGITTIAAALQTLPGVTLAQNGSFGASTSLFLRGGESKYVKVLLDGVPMNDPGGAMDFSTLTTDNVERIEIVRGPASVLYGADAVTGVIQIFTRRGRGAPHATVSARAGTYSSTDGDASVLGAFSSGDFSLGLARHDTKGIYAFNNAYHNTVASGAYHLNIDSRTDLRLMFRYNDGAYHYPTNGGGDPVDSNAMQSVDRTALSAEIGRLITTRIDARLTLTSDETSGGTDDRPDTPASGGFESVDRTRRRGADLRANVDLPGATILTGGAEAEQEDERTESQSVFGTFNSTSVFSATRHNTAAYLQTLTTLPQSVVVTLGGRRDANEQFGIFGTYRAGASWRAPTGTQLRASAGTAFREPTFLENYSTGFVTGNRALRPERTATWEAGIRQPLFADRVSLGITHFDQRFRDMIDYTGSTTSCGASYCNVARAVARGNEFEAHVTPTAHLALDANLTHLETRVLNPGDTANGSLYVANQPLIRRPTTTWNIGGAFLGSDGSIDVRVTHVGARVDRDFRPFPALSVIDPAYMRTDVGATLPLADFSSAMRGVELTLHVENLFDANYQSVYNFLSPRRTVLVGGRMTF